MDKFKSYIGLFVSLFVLLLLMPTHVHYEERVKISYFDKLFITRLVSSRDVGFDIVNANYKYKNCLTKNTVSTKNDQLLRYEKIASQVLNVEVAQQSKCSVEFKLFPESLMELAKISESLQYYLVSGGRQSSEAEKLIIELTDKYSIANVKMVKMKLELSVLIVVIIFLIFVKFRAILGGFVVSIIQSISSFILKNFIYIIKGIHKKI